MKFSIIIPTLNEEDNIAGCIQSISNQKPAYPFEVIIVDGGSSDGTLEKARGLAGRTGDLFPVRIIETGTPGLARQLNLGSSVSSGRVLIFLHADNSLPKDAMDKIERLFNRDKRFVGGSFTMMLEGDRLYYRVSSFLGNLFSRMSRIYFGDKVIFVRRDVFEKLGGFREIPVMSDYDFSKKMKNAGRTVLLKGPTYTSPRGMKGPFWRRTYLIVWALFAFEKGVDPAIIRDRYYQGYSRK